MRWEIIIIIQRLTRKAEQMQKFGVKENPSKLAKFGHLPRLRGVRVRISYLGFFSGMKDPTYRYFFYSDLCDSFSLFNVIEGTENRCQGVAWGKANNGNLLSGKFMLVHFL